jgi:hypothetical protein
MNTEPSPPLAKSALAAKRLAESNQTKRNLVFFAGIGMAILAFVAYIVTNERVDVEPNNFVVAVAIGSVSAGLMLWRFSAYITPSLAACPNCGLSWEIKEGRYVPYSERMPLWDRCPGCGLPMRTALLEHIAQGAGRLE